MRKKAFRYMGLITAILTLFSTVATFIYFRFFHNSQLTYATAYFAIAGFTLLFAGLIMSFLFSGSVIFPLMRGREEAISKYEELEPLLRRMERQRSQIKVSASELEEKSINLRMIMEFMEEGLILLDSRALIISMNRSAAELLELTDADYKGKHIFAANRDPLLQAAVHTAVGGKSAEEKMEQGGAVLQIMANPVFVGGVVRGIVLLVFDVTEKQAIEQMRREFSANVSHELKTPLTSISGIAEIMRDGLVKPEDTKRFAGMIYTEASRLIALVDDIMKLSRLDEESPGLSRERVSLMETALDVAERLREKAAENEVTLKVTGAGAFVVGNTQVLGEMVFNLCDNAIKYNKPGGEVELSVEVDGQTPVLTVRDNGIGIPREHHARIFERFYRVDKSHSKETGGTGLGLSIVKHGAIFHGADVAIDSKPGLGTSITLRFEKNV